MHLVEPDYLPFAAGDLPPGPWLVLAPHPDDETFGMGGSIRRAADFGVKITVIVLTDGALGGADRPDLVPIRESEARAASEILGISAIEFWSEPDRALTPRPDLITRLSSKILQQRPRTLFFPSLTEPHPDHRAAALIGWEALRQSGFCATPVGYEISSQGPINLLLDVTDSIAAKSRAMDVYASQEAERPYCKRVIAQNIARTWSLPDTVQYAEAFLVLDAGDAPLADIVKPIFLRYLLGLAIEAPNQLAGGSASGHASDCEAALRALSDELRRIKTSRSWRWTAPYRHLNKLLRELSPR
jgi:LmbE family N-acetylglucosaminyl deacetylase